MNRKALGALITLNVVLLLALGLSGFAPSASAQAFGGPQYRMIAGKTAGRTGQSIIYITDLASTKMVAVIFNSSNNTLTPLDGRVLKEDMLLAGGAGGR